MPTRRAARFLTLAIMTAASLLATPRPADAHDRHVNWKAENVMIPTPVGDMAATLFIPHAEERVPCILILGGSLSHDRNGRLDRPGAPPRDALLRLAESLQAGGYASLRYDQPGHGQSRPADRFRGTYTDHAKVASALIDYLRADARIGAIVVAGESAGAYHACLAAKMGAQADGYIFLGGLCRSGPDMYAYTFGELVRWAERSPENMAWAKQHARHEMALGRHYQAWFDAAAKGDDAFDLEDGDYRCTLRAMDRRREELEMPPDPMFRYIQAPSLALAGEKDLNVHPGDAARIAQQIRRSGNLNVRSLLIAGADHSFQAVPEDENTRYRERYGLDSFKRPYRVQVYQEMLRWLQDRFPSPVEAEYAELALIASRPTRPDEILTTRPAMNEITYPFSEPLTEYTPARLFLSPGITIIDDVTDMSQVPGVDTLEGRIGPLMLTLDSQCHYIDMPPGMYVEEHPHASGSLIYTARGQWVLCSDGRRHHMRTGNLFRFEPNTPTGYEVPFDEPACLLIFKDTRLSESEQVFIEYLRALVERLDARHAEGTPFLLSELPADHPARLFARKVNPQWAQRLDRSENR